MSKKIVDVLKAKVRESEYTNLRSTEETLDSGYRTYHDLGVNLIWKSKFPHDFVINGKVINDRLIDRLCLEHENLIPKDKDEKGDYRPFLKEVFTKMFWHADARIPNNSIMEELKLIITGLGTWVLSLSRIYFVLLDYACIPSSP